MSIQHVRKCESCPNTTLEHSADGWIKVEMRLPPAEGRMFGRDVRWDYCSEECFAQIQNSRDGLAILPPVPVDTLTLREGG